MEKCECCGTNDVLPGPVPLCRECVLDGERELDQQAKCPTCGCWHGYFGGYDCGG